MYCKKAVATSPPFCYALHYKYSTFEEPKQGVSEKLIATFNELCITNEKIGTYPFKTDFNPAERNFVLQFSFRFLKYADIPYFLKPDDLDKNSALSYYKRAICGKTQMRE